MVHAVAPWVQQVELGQALEFENLTVFPLVGDGVRQPIYLTLDDAIGRGLVAIEEVSEAGSVSQVQVRNKAPQPVLLVDGEELVGAKQNRIVNLTIMVPANRTLVIPVSCVEAGRWRHSAAGFAPAPRTQYATARGEKVRDVTASLRREGSRQADQHAIWDGIAAKAYRMNAFSETGAMSAIFEQHATSIEAYVQALTASDGQRGAVFAVGPSVVGLDLFDSAETLRKILPKLVRSYAADAIETAGHTRRKASARQAAALLAAVAGAEPQSFPAIGEGQDLRFESNGVTGGALAVGGALVHLTAFAVRNQRPAGTRIHRSRRHPAPGTVIE
jgi:hypothetical protein